MRQKLLLFFISFLMLLLIIITMNNIILYECLPQIGNVVIRGTIKKCPILCNAKRYIDHFNFSFLFVVSRIYSATAQNKIFRSFKILKIKCIL